MNKSNQLKRLFITVLIVLIIPKAFTEIINEEQNNDTHYTIRINEKNPAIAYISFELVLQDSILYMWTGANELPDRWAAFVHSLEIKDQKRENIKFEKLTDARWQVNATKGDKIHVDYELHLDHGNYEWESGLDGKAYLTDWGVFYTGRALFMFNGNSSGPIDINFQLPNRWNVSTPWQSKDGRDNAFTVLSIEELAESMLFAGTHEEYVVKRAGFELVFAMGGEEIIAQKEEFKQLAKGVLDYYINLMGGVPNLPPGNQSEKTIVIINSASTTDGEVVGNSISILIDKNGDQMSQLISRFIFAHEFFHLWNGKSFQPAQDDAEWFKEGFTNYYTLKALHHVGFLNDTTYLNVLSDFFYQRYINDGGTGSLSMTNGNEKHDHWGLIYAGGMFVGIAQDMIIRNETDNQKSMDNLMRTLFQKYGGTNESYNLTELKNMLSMLSGKNQDLFFEKYVVGNNVIPIEDFLSLAAIEANVDDKVLKIKLKENPTQKQGEIIDGLYGKINSVKK